MRTKIYMTMIAGAVCLGLLAYSAARSAAQDGAGQTVETAAADNPAPAPGLELKDNVEKLSYHFGTQIGSNLLRMRKEGIELKMDVFKRGMDDALAERKLALTTEEQKAVMAGYRELATQKKKQLADKSKADSIAFLAANKTKAGVVTLPSGLQYKVLTAGTGARPKATDQVKTHYRGTLIDGTQFDSSYDRNAPSTFGVTRVIKGWTEALKLMKVGAKWELFVPSELAYGAPGRPNIPANSALIFEIELLEIVP